MGGQCLPAGRPWSRTLQSPFFPSVLFHFFSKFFTLFLFYIGVQLIYTIVLASGVRQSDSLIHTHVSILFQVLSPYRPIENIKQSSLCYTVDSC